MVNPAEVWKEKKHSFDVWPDVLRHAGAATPMAEIETPDLERMKWYGFFYRKRDTPGRYMNRIRVTANELTSDQGARDRCDRLRARSRHRRRHQPAPTSRCRGSASSTCRRSRRDSPRSG